MRTVETKDDFRRIRKLPFCYLCGTEFTSRIERDRDHVPPKAVFEAADRIGHPLILPTHPSCNQTHSGDDQILAEFVSVLHTPDRNRDRLQRHLATVSGETGEPFRVGLHGTSLPLAIWRWVRGFHTALYEEYLPDIRGRAVHVPLPEGRLKDKYVSWSPILPQQPLIVETLRVNLMAKSVDQVVCYSGRCRYVCCWERADNGRPICFFGLQLYNWESLGDARIGPRRACVGTHSPPAGQPPLATRATRLEARLHGRGPLNPFE